MESKPKSFSSTSSFRRWLVSHHHGADELNIGFSYKEALCFGWIGGVRKNVDASSFSVRFSPRKPKSVWSEINVARATELKALGAFEARDEHKTREVSHEQRTRGLDAALEEKFTANGMAWKFFAAQTPAYQTMASWWVISAKMEKTRLRRLATLMQLSEKGQRLTPISLRAIVE